MSMIGIDEAINILTEIHMDLLYGREVKEENLLKLPRAINRINYLRDRDVGCEVRKIPKLNGRDYLVSCGNCGNEAIERNPHYQFCPNCGFKVKR